MYAEVNGLALLCRLCLLHEAQEAEAVCILGRWVGVPCWLCLPHEAQEGESMGILGGGEGVVDRGCDAGFVYCMRYRQA